jgi:hypothetical protein
MPDQRSQNVGPNRLFHQYMAVHRNGARDSVAMMFYRWEYHTCSKRQVARIPERFDGNDAFREPLRSYKKYVASIFDSTTENVGEAHTAVWQRWRVSIM